MGGCSVVCMGVLGCYVQRVILYGVHRGVAAASRSSDRSYRYRKPLRGKLRPSGLHWLMCCAVGTGRRNSDVQVVTVTRVG